MSAFGIGAGRFGYIPTPDASPVGGYEADTSPFAPESVGHAYRSGDWVAGEMFG